MSEPGPQGQPDDALLDLLVKQACEGLSPAEQQALAGLDGPAAKAAARLDVERAAAAVMLAGLGPLEAPPAALRARLGELAGAEITRVAASSGTSASTVRPASVTELAPARASQTTAAPRPAASRGNAGWFAAAACLLLALVGWLRTPPAPPPVAVEQPAPALPPRPPTLAEERAALLAKSGSIKVTLAATKDPAGAGVTGDAVWDPATQRGFLHFSGLAANDPTVRQYQLWIFDAERDKRYPIDGGVFDVPADAAAEAIIPIRAALPVRQAAAFAVTLEKPGGVVVSARDHVVVLGAAG